ncbi:hypothetical protein CRG98_028494 [Punica granatum]|uniref:Uncharacterized protein n=1 Tax=Punica granatum TaxID=22663 RepID=A0A2I0J4G8_PUNGR|nr:hypothetical protein CRG98_028494 [Punica granatum]
MPQFPSLLSITALFIFFLSPSPHCSSAPHLLRRHGSLLFPSPWKPQISAKLPISRNRGSNFTSIDFTGYNSSQNNYSSKDSLSTQPSLSRLKDQLLSENPNIYHFSEIPAAIDGLSTGWFSSTWIQSLIKALVSVSISNAWNRSLIEATRLLSKPC